MPPRATPIELYVIQGRVNVREFVHQNLVNQGCKQPIPADWQDKLKEEFPGLPTDKLRFITAEAYRYKCTLCDTYPADFKGVVGHLGGKKHCKKEKLWSANHQ